MDRGAWWATVHRVTELDMTEVTAHVCTEQTFSEVSLCSTASCLLPPRSSVRPWQPVVGGVSNLFPPSVSTGALVFLLRNKKSVYRKKTVVSGCLPFILWSGDHFSSFERKTECWVLRGIRSEATPVFGPGEFHRLYSPWGHKELDTTEWLSLFTFLHRRRVGMKMIGWGWTEVFNLTIWSNPKWDKFGNRSLVSCVFSWRMGQKTGSLRVCMDFPGVQWSGLYASGGGSTASIPGCITKILHAPCPPPLPPPQVFVKEGMWKVDPAHLGRNYAPIIRSSEGDPVHTWLFRNLLLALITCSLFFLPIPDFWLLY